MRIVIDDKIPYVDGALEALRVKLAERGRTLEVVRKAGSEIGAADVADAEVLVVRTRTRCDGKLLSGSQVRLVVTATIGYDHIDTEFMRQAGIAWTNCPGCNATSVAQYVGACLLLLQRERGLSLKDITLGIIGVGHVGTAVAATAQHLGIGRLLLNDPPRQAQEETARIGGETYKWSSLAEVLAESDVITLHTPLTNEGLYPTLHLIDSEAIAQMRQRPVLINAARGGIVDETALESALDSGDVSAAIIDTWEHEPDISPTLLAKAYLATPHIAGYSADGKANATRMSMEAVAQHLGLDMTFDVKAPTQTRSYATNAGEADNRTLPTDTEERALWLYDPRVDSRRLKASRTSFETLRGHYPLRREATESPQ